MPKLNEAAATNLDALLQAVNSPLDPTDLGRLAQLHTMLQDVVGEFAADSPPAKLGAGAVRLLEALILDEAADAASGMQAIPEAIIALHKAGNDDISACDAALAKVTGAMTGEVPTAANAPAPQPQPVTPPAATAAKSTAFTPEPVPEPRLEAPTPPAPAKAPAPADEAYVAEPLIVDLNEQEHLQGFIDESAEHMDAIEVALLGVEQNPADADQINELFRPFHTIKGIAGFLNLRDINRLTHEVETILDMARKHELKLTAGHIDLIFAAIDVLKDQIGRLAHFLTAPTDSPVPQPVIVDIMARLRKAQRGEVNGGGRSTAAADAPTAAGPAPNPPSAQTAGKADSGAAKEEGGDNAARGVDNSIRVDTRKLDALVDAVGELVIAQTMVNLSERVRVDEKLSRDVSQVTKIVRDIQETALAMRMVPIGSTFQKMRRLVRDVAKKAGKEVDLQINGEETELDKTVVQQISDPLVHMVRNAIDHGLEPPNERESGGKARAGKVRLNAFHQGDSITIQIADDGRGLDRDKLIKKAIERGMISPEDELTDQQAYMLIMGAGFSTAEQITDISGRGVGMDVVRRNIEALRGKIEIQSNKGSGTTFNIRLPLTLAIIDGMLVRLGDQRLIIPTISIEQSLRPSQISSVQRRGEMIKVRGELVPLIQLGQIFGFAERIDPCDALVVIVQAESGRIGVVVEELIGQQQVVIKTLGDRFKSVQGISGAAILGDGRIGLIVEPSGLLKLHTQSNAPLLSDANTPHEKPQPEDPQESIVDMTLETIV
ncbi:MAG: chemotaxis protein CheW [Phycisphaerales bacterium]|nr:chemotaxis protein CheW [Phycisphaerales bacterium]